MTSTTPDTVTCLACRDWAHAEHTMIAEGSEAVLQLDTLTAEQRTQYQQTADKHRALAAAFKPGGNR